MKKSILGTILASFLVVGLTGCGSSTKNVDVVGDLNKIYEECLSQNDKSTCMMNWTLQSYLETYSSYRLLNASSKEFTIKPQEPNSLFTYGASRDALCDYDYALFYNKDGNSYYSLQYDCDNNNPTFTNASLLK